MHDFLDLTKESLRYSTDPKEKFALDVLMGLSSTPKSISAKYFYDSLGSELFLKIMNLEEYYPTRCESQILKCYSKNILQRVKANHINIIELGAGDGKKTKIMLEEFIKQQTEIAYFPIDISRAALESLFQDFSRIFPNLAIQPVIAEYYEGMRWLSQNKRGRNLVLFLGSNIGNFSRSQSLAFLKTLWNSLNDGDFLLLGCDLKKDIDVLLNAYNDSKGVTDEFNLNLLTRMNKELGANFDPSKFHHYGTYDVKLGAMESFLVSNEKQAVYIKELNRSFSFEPFEAIHCEYSMKYLTSDIESMAQGTGFSVVDFFYDDRKYFVDALFKVEKDLQPRRPQN